MIHQDESIQDALIIVLSSHCSCLNHNWIESWSAQTFPPLIVLLLQPGWVQKAEVQKRDFEHRKDRQSHKIVCFSLVDVVKKLNRILNRLCLTLVCKRHCIPPMIRMAICCHVEMPKCNVKLNLQPWNFVWKGICTYAFWLWSSMFTSCLNSKRHETYDSHWITHAVTCIEH